MNKWCLTQCACLGTYLFTFVLAVFVDWVLVWICILLQNSVKALHGANTDFQLDGQKGSFDCLWLHHQFMYLACVYSAILVTLAERMSWWRITCSFNLWQSIQMRMLQFWNVRSLLVVTACCEIVLVSSLLQFIHITLWLLVFQLHTSPQKVSLKTVRNLGMYKKA